jgi:hypothetical protein
LPLCTPFFYNTIVDGLVKSLKRRLSVNPAHAGFQCFQVVRVFWIPVFTGMATFYDSIIVGKVGGRNIAEVVDNYVDLVRKFNSE